MLHYGEKIAEGEPEQVYNRPRGGGRPIGRRTPMLNIENLKVAYGKAVARCTT